MGAPNPVVFADVVDDPPLQLEVTDEEAPAARHQPSSIQGSTKVDWESFFGPLVIWFISACWIAAFQLFMLLFLLVCNYSRCPDGQPQGKISRCPLTLEAPDVNSKCSDGRYAIDFWRCDPNETIAAVDESCRSVQLTFHTLIVVICYILPAICFVLGYISFVCGRR